MPVFCALCLAMALAIPGRAIASAPCTATAPCQLASGQYIVRPPSGWNGRDNLPALVFFHGWRETAEQVLADPALAGFADAEGLLLVAPQGAGMTWSYPGSPGRHRDEFTFVTAMMEDLARRFPLKRSRLVAAGFSQGGSMVWYLACYSPAPFTHFLAVAGGFWEPAPRQCPGSPAAIAHVHGTADPTVPLAGRALRGGLYRQSDILRDWSVWTAPQCSPGQREWSPQAEPDYACRQPEGCRKSAIPVLCLRPGGHALTAADLRVGWQALRLSAP